MALKYRVKVWSTYFNDYHNNHELDYYTAEYRIFGIWFYINKMQTGRLFRTTSVICETQDEAINRIKIHKKNMKRASIFYDIKDTIVFTNKEL